MMKYYTMREIENSKYSLFDTIAFVGNVCGFTYSEMLYWLGFKSSNSIVALMHDSPAAYFSIEQYLIPRLNDILRECNVNTRIVRKYRGYYYDRERS